jgi:signal transduction histidine kinase
MLVISKTDAGAGDLAMQPVNMAEMVRAALALFGPLAEDKGIAMNCDMPDALMVDGDLRMLQRATANLLDNAIKYTPAGGRIDICGFHDNKDSERINISIRDNGIGIHNHELSKIFDRFYRCDQSRAAGGSGLGLSLAIAIARAHHGNILVESAPGKGSLFTLSLPEGKAAAPAC